MAPLALCQASKSSPKHPCIPDQGLAACTNLTWSSRSLLTCEQQQGEDGWGELGSAGEAVLCAGLEGGCTVTVRREDALPVLRDGWVGLGRAVELDGVVLQDWLRLHGQVHQGGVCKETATRSHCQPRWAQQPCAAVLPTAPESGKQKAGVGEHGRGSEAASCCDRMLRAL